MAGRGAAVAPDVHVDLHRNRVSLSRLSSLQRKLSAGIVHAQRYSWGVADGEALLFLRPEARGARGLQPSTEACVYDGDRSGSAFGAHRARHLEAGAVFVAGVDDGRIPLGALVALRGDVGSFGIRAWTSGDGDLARLEQLCFDADGLEERSRVLTWCDSLAI